MSAADWISLEDAERRRKSKSPSQHRLNPQFLDLTALSAEPVPPQQWLVENFIPCRNVTMLSGDGGIGKSRLTLQLQVSAALRMRWIGREVTACRSLGIYAEDDEDELHRRLFAIAAHYGVTLSELQDLLRIASGVGFPCEFLTHRNAIDPGRPTEFFNGVLEQVREFRPGLVVLDSLHDFFAGNELSRPQARQFVALCRRISIECECSVVLNAHPSQSGLQSGSGTSGSTGWNNAVRSRLYFSKPDGVSADDDLRLLSTKKANYARIGSDISIRWQDGVFVPDHPSISGQATIEADFIACLERARKQGILPSPSKQSCYYAPKALRVAGCKHSIKALEAAMERLFGMQALKIVAVQDKERKWRDVVQAAELNPDDS